jgi:uncharacterized repeat protein (TIGR01451 family)
MKVHLSGVLALAVLALHSISTGHGTVRAAPATASRPSPAATAAPAPATGAATLDRAARTRVMETLAHQPLRFEANAGQFAANVRFAARGVGYGVALTPTGATLTLATADRAAAVAMIVVDRDGAPASARDVAGRDLLAGVVNRYIGDDPARWRTGVGQFARVRHAGVYEGIDLEFYGNQRRLEYDFLIAPDADPSAIRIRFDGATKLEIDRGGDLLLHVDAGPPLRQQAPVSYQVVAGVRTAVSSRYVRLGDREVGFDLGAYDRSAPLTIDPVLVYSTYFGGTSEENIHDIALDPAGNIYVTGRSQDLAGFPTTPGAFQPTKPGPTLGTDGFVSKFNAAGTALVYSTFLGGSSNDNNRALRAGRIAVDAAGNAYVTGDTESTDFPVSGNAADGTFGGGGASVTDGFYVKLGPTGTFLYGTFIGGSDIDYAHGISVDAAGSVYVMGATRSDAAEGFPQTANAYSGVLSGTQDAFLSKFDANGARVYSTFLGGTGQENSFLSVGGGVVVDGAGRAYVTGETPGPGFPIVGGYQAIFGGQYDAFLAVIDTTLSGAASLVYSTYLGGTGQDLGYDIAYAGTRQVVIVGEADPGFPVVNALDATYNGGNSDVFVARFDTSLTGNASLIYSTFVGGSDYDFPWDVAIDPLGAVHVVGETRSTNFPAVNPIRTNFFLIEPFVFKMNAAGTALVYSTLFGIESNYKQVRAVATNAAGDTFIAGGTNDTNSPTGPTHFPRVNAFQSAYGGGDADGIIARIANGVDLILTKTAAPEPVATGGTLTYTLTVTNSSTDPAIAVTLTDPLPAGLTFASCSATGGACGGSGNSRTVTYPSLAAGASSTVTITATVTAGMGATLVNTATVTTASFEPNTANNTATATSHTPGVNPNDTDNDALPNDWETRFGLDPSSNTADNGAGGDPDGDGRTNFQEFEEGSHPRGFVITYLAEGATGTFFDTRLALANPTSTPALVLTRFQRDGAAMVPVYTQIAPHSRATLDVETVSGMESAAFSSLIEADVQVVADRTMTWDSTGFGSHAERGILTRTSTTWYLAEGATHGFFDLFYLLQNPGPQPAEVEISYLLPAPAAPIVRTYTVAPTSRRTIYIDQVPGLEATDVSASLRSTNSVPFIAERAMYFSLPTQTFAAGHESAGVTAAANRWFLAEGATGSFFNMFILVANPSAQAATVEMQYLLTSGQVITRAHTVGAQNRLTINVATEDPLLASAAMSTIVTSTNNVPIVVERAMWWPSTGGPWYEAHNSPGETTTGVRWAMAEGESGGPQGRQTYILIANTSGFAGSARVTLLFEDGTTAEKTVNLPANSRTNVNPQAEFAGTDGRRYGALIESLGATPAELVVERAMYSNAGGVTWAAGTNALATKLQ